MDIYDKLYDAVIGNMLTANCQFKYEKQTFMCDVGSHPKVIDISKYLQLENKLFLQALFVGVFRRLPELKEVAVWQMYFDEPVEKFQEKVLRKTVNSSVVAINQIRFINNPYFRQKRGLKYKMLGTLYVLTDKSYLREFGKKMPQSIQKIIRKVFL